MSVSVISWAFNQRLSSSAEKFVLVKIADNSNDEGYAWPSINRIMFDTALEKPTVIKCILSLEKKGLLSVERRKEGGVNLRNRYRLHLHAQVAEEKKKHKRRKKNSITSPAELGGLPDKPLVCQIIEGGLSDKPLVYQIIEGGLSDKPITIIEPSLKTTTTALVVVPSENEKEKDNDSPKTSPTSEMQDDLKGTPLESVISPGAIRAAIKSYRPEAHADHQPETPLEGIKRIMDWMQHIQLPKNPAGFLVQMARNGMDKPPTVARAEQSVEAERQERKRRERERESIQNVKNEKLTDDEQNEIKKLIAGITKTNPDSQKTNNIEDRRQLLEKQAQMLSSHDTSNVIPLRRQI